MDEYEVYKQRMAALSGAIFLFGLAGLFLADAIFPAILPLIFVTAIPVLIAEQGWKYGGWILAQMAIWLGGIPILLTIDQIFPGVLVLAGLSALLVAIAPPDQLDKEHQAWREEYRTRLAAGEGKAKRKRIPLPPVDDEDDLTEFDDDALTAEAAHSAQEMRSHRQ